MGIYTLSEQKIENEVHKIIQYLAAAGNSFLPKKNDDSHTNLKSLTGCGCVTTRPLNDKGDVLAFKYTTFTLEWWLNGGDKIKLSLHGITHKEIIDWIRELGVKNGITKPYRYQMHYELPYHPITDDYIFYLENKQRLSEIMHYRIMAHLALEDVLQNMKPHSEIRVWPHHFDIASIYSFNKSKNHTIGLGMAIPDEISPEFYFYAKGYAGEQHLDISEVSKLQYGRWDRNFNGAVMQLGDNTTLKMANRFFNQAVHILKNEARI